MSACRASLHPTSLILLVGLLSSILHSSKPIVIAAAVPASVTTASLDKNFPPDSGIVNIKTAYGAKGDGITDDTQAILRAIREHIGYTGATKVIYFPKGTYLVSDQLVWKNTSGKWDTYLTFQGQNREQTVIKLKDNAPGYSNSKNRKSVIYTAAKNGRTDGGGNEAHRNYIFDLTVDTGRGNPSAIGIDYHANNQGAMRNVTIRSGDGTGKTGLRMARSWPGPCLIKNVKVVGFDTGIYVGNSEYSLTLENIELENQKVTGIVNYWNVLSIRGLTSRNSVPAIKNNGLFSDDNRSLLVVIDGNFSGGSASNVAIDNFAGQVYARNITTSGYQAAIKNKDTVVTGTSLQEYFSTQPYSLFASPQRSLNLLIEETPSYYDQNLNNWVNVRSFGATPSDGPNDTAAIHAAIDSTITSGKSTIYFPTGYYRVNQTLVIRGNVRKIVGMQSRIESYDSSYFSNPNSLRPFLQIADGISNLVVMDDLDIGGGLGTNAGAISIEQASSRSLVIQDSSLGGTIAYRNTANAGKLFIEDIVGGRFRFDYPQKVWARHLNTEINDLKIRNNGATLWLLGVKTENISSSGLPTVIETRGGGKTELLGGLLYPTTNVPTSLPAFINHESSISLIYAVSVYGAPTANYQIHVQETRGGITKTLSKNQFSGRDVFGSLMPLYTGFTP